MKDDMPSSSWALLAPEMLDQIFQHVPRHMLSTVGHVCTAWQAVVHQQAVRYLTPRIQNHLIAENQLKRCGLSTADTIRDHRIENCSCIRLAFDSFVKTKGPYIARKTPWKSVIFSLRVGIIAGKVFFLNIDRENKVVLCVMNRLEPDSQPRTLAAPAEHQLTVHEENRKFLNMAACEDLLVLMLEDRVSLWSGRSETWLGDLDVATQIAVGPNVVISNISVGKNLLAVQLFGSREKNQVHFWQVDTSEPTGKSPKFLGTVGLPANPRALRRTRLTDDFVLSMVADSARILINERFVGLFYSGNEIILSIDRAELLTADCCQHCHTRFQKADPDQPGSRWQLLQVDDAVVAAAGERIWSIANHLGANWDFAELEPGLSSRLALGWRRRAKFKIMDLITGQVLCRIATGAMALLLSPASWCGGNFLMIKTLQRPDSDQPADDDQGEVQIMVLDLPSCQGSALQTEEHLLPGVKVSFSGAPDVFGKSCRARLVCQVDYLGLVAAGWDSFFTAATGD
jgi:hypothetical protein